MKGSGLVITSVADDSIADELRLQPGDVLLQINGQDVNDIIDYQYLVAEEYLLVLICRYDEEHWLLEIVKDYDDPLGLSFQNDGWGTVHQCINKCIFCFVDQMPPDTRSSLRIKDDDYRLSFVQGNFITLTNIEHDELERIARMRLSPLYISVHTTNPELRSQIMGNAKAGNIMEQIHYLASQEIVMHTQIVLCPGINDGPELKRTITDLIDFWPLVNSIAVVPVGLTCHRQGLRPVRSYSAQEARAVIREVVLWQKTFLSEFQNPIIFAGDEFYLLAGAPIPEADKYGDFPQIENGVGMARLFLDKWQSLVGLLPRSVKGPKRCSIVTGTLAGSFLTAVVADLNQVAGLKITLHVLENKYFGKTVTVAGLLTGYDLLESLKGLYLGQQLFIPGVMLKEDKQVFLDNMTLEYLATELGVPVIPVNDLEELLLQLGLYP